jgi:hypothetical protein
MDDPRWSEVFAFIDWMAADRHIHDGAEFIERFRTYCRTLDAIAADPTVAPEERAVAAEIVGLIDTHFRAHTNDALRAVARIAGAPNAAGDLRTEAEEMLVRAIERMPTVSDKSH